MSKIETGQFSTFLRRYLGMKGVSDVVDELAPEISPTFVLEAERPEWEFLKGARLMSASGIIAASVGLNSAVRIENKAATGVVGIIEGIIITVGANSQVRITINNDAGQLATTFQSNSRDSRYPRVAFPGNSALVVSGDYGLNGDSLCDATLLANSPFTYAIPIVLTPGFQVQVTTVAANIGLLVSYNWLEKRLDDLEQR